MTFRKTRRVAGGLIVAAAVTATVALAATAATSRSSGGTILVGSIAGTTGAYGSTGVAMQNGAQMAVDDLNAKGGALGKKFKLEAHNDQASATLASQLFQRLVGAGDDAGITIYPNGPSKPPLPYVWSWGLNTFAFGGIDAAYAIKNCKGGLA